MKYYPVNKPVCDCPADTTRMSAVIEARRRGVVVRSQIVRHYREVDDAHFWHWKDTTDLIHIIQGEEQ